MRTIIILLFSIMAMSCVTPSFPTETVGGYVYSGYDFRKYADQGLLITTTPPIGNYISIGIVSLTLYPEVKEITSAVYTSSINRNGLIDSNGKKFEVIMVSYPNGAKRYYRVEVTNTDDVIDQLVNTAVSWGADAIYEFSVSNNAITDNGLSKVVRNISGFAVKREAVQIEIIEN